MIEPRNLPAVLSNLEKAAEKQHRDTVRELLGKLADEFVPTAIGDGSDDAPFDSLRGRIVGSLDTGYAAVRAAAAEADDRGALRAATWGEKVTMAQRALVDRFRSKGASLLEDNNLYVCEACGFIYAGTSAPEICPVCKAPRNRFARVQ